MTKLMVLMAAVAGAAGTFFWLKGGGDLNHVKDRAKRAMNQAEGEANDMMNEFSRSGGGGYVPA